MSKNNKISYYSIDDINNIEAVDNIHCHVKSFSGIFSAIVPFLFILVIVSLIANIMQIQIWISIILLIVLSVATFSFLVSKHSYDRFTNFHLYISGKKIIYINNEGKIFNYNESDLLNAKLVRPPLLTAHWHMHIEINMSDNQKIYIWDYYRGFYKLMTYLESKEFFEK